MEQRPALVRITHYTLCTSAENIFCFLSTWSGKCFHISFYSLLYLQWIVGGVSGRPGARAVAHVTWASDAAIVQQPIQRRRLVAVPVRASASDWTRAALHLVSVQ